jgi:uncharacterized protein (DUF2062 family)
MATYRALAGMEPAVIAAVVAGAVSLLVTYGKMLWESREKKQEREQERRLAAREQRRLSRSTSAWSSLNSWL